MKNNFYSSVIKKIKAVNFKKISLATWLTIIGIVIIFALMLTPGSSNKNKSPRVMFWYGKVNQHFDVKNKTWMTDSDAYSGAEMNKLTYCQKFYPRTIRVAPYKEETINSWHSVGNTGQYEATKMSYLCEEK